MRRNSTKSSRSRPVSGRAPCALTKDSMASTTSSTLLGQRRYRAALLTGCAHRDALHGEGGVAVLHDQLDSGAYGRIIELRVTGSSER